VTTGGRQNCTVDDAEAGGCIRKADHCTNIEGARCSVKPSQQLLLWFFVFDLLSFGFSIILVMFVACSVPRTGRSEPRAAAGFIWLSLVVASSLLMLAVACGMLALLFGLPTVYPVALRSWVLVPWCMSSMCMVLLFVFLLAHWRAVFAGPHAVWVVLPPPLQRRLQRRQLYEP
jgi:lysylphosphatidylglycerol synthetase-like protein (DUF2156 family)